MVQTALTAFFYLVNVEEMAVTSGGGGNNFVLNIVELQNTINSASGIDTATAVSQLQQMVNYGNKSIAVNSIGKFDTSPIQVTDPINFTSATVGGSSIGGTGISNGSVGITTTDTGNATTGAVVISVPSGAAMTVYGDGHTVFTGAVSAAAFITTSDARVKECIRPLEDSLAKINSLEGVSFQWLGGGRENIGFIAQDVSRVIPEAARYDHVNDLYQIEVTSIIPHLVEAVKTLTARVSALESELSRL